MTKRPTMTGTPAGPRRRQMWWRRHERFVGNFLAPLVVMALLLGGFALKDQWQADQCTSRGEHPDWIGGEFDDIFLVCRDDRGRITQVYADRGGDPDQQARCVDQGGQLFINDVPRSDPIMMCVADGQMAWWAEK